MPISVRLVALIGMITLAMPPASAQAPQPIRLVEAFPGLTFPNVTEIVPHALGGERLIVVEQRGILRLVDYSDTPVARTFLNIESQVSFGGEAGMLGVAFHPEYKAGGFVFVSYMTPSPLRTRISRFTNPAPEDPNSSLDPDSEVIYLEVPQPRSNHNGGQIQFGPDGFLYIGLGDSGGSGDPDNAAQDRTWLLGSLLRIDPDVTNDEGNYRIPAGNPYVGNESGWLEEIYAYGLRNPWKFAFGDRGDVWVADVGQNLFEEVNLIEPGGNYGWVVMEGPNCFDNSRPENPPCNDPALEAPVHFYQHGSDTGRSITGGLVYRGQAEPSLMGAYVFGDYISGNIWAIRHDGDNFVTTQIYDACTTFSGCPPERTRYLISTFGQDSAGEMYVAHYATSGRIFRVAGVPVSAEGGPSQRLFLNAYPNPVTGSLLNVQIELQQAGFVSATLHDVLGREVATLLEGDFAPGSSSHSVNLPALASGIYLLRLESGNTTVTRRLTLID